MLFSLLFSNFSNDDITDKNTNPQILILVG